MAPGYRSAELAEFLHGLEPESLPPAVVSAARRCLLDALGCGLFGSLQPWSRILADEMIAEKGAGGCVVFGRDSRLSPPAAALCNGLAIHGYELDDLIASSIIHPAAAVVPAALAAAEAHGESGGRLLLGIAAGYEIMHRLAAAMGVAPSRAGFHVTSLAAPVAAAMAAGKVMRLDQAELASAIGNACSAAAGIKAFAAGHGGGMVKRLHLGRGAEAGVRACQLARRGFSGPPYAIDGKNGLLALFGRETASDALLTEALGAAWAVEDVWFKIYPICGWIQPVVQILSGMRGGRDWTAREIRAVRVGVSSYAAANNGDPAPVDTMGMQYSIPFCAALALLGNPLDPVEYGDKRLHDPAMRALQSRVAIHVSEAAESVYPTKFAADVELRLADGSIMHEAVEDCRGTPANPCTDAELEEKFQVLASRAIGAPQARTLARAVEDVATMPRIGGLTRLLAESRHAA